MCIPILTSATVKPARPSLARRVPVVPGRPCPSRPSRRRVRRARRACRHRRPRRARRPRPAHGDPHSSREPPGPTDVAISAGTPRTPSSGFRDPEMSRMCRGPTVDSKNAGIHTRTPGRRGPTVVDRGPRDDLPPRKPGPSHQTHSNTEHLGLKGFPSGDIDKPSTGTWGTVCLSYSRSR